MQVLAKKDFKASFIPGVRSSSLAIAALGSLAAGLLIWSARSSSEAPFVVWSIACAVGALLICRFDYLNPLLAFLFPWLAIAFFGRLELSRFARPLSSKTYEVFWAINLSALAAYYVAARKRPLRSARPRKEAVSVEKFSVLVGLFAVLTIFNVAAAGYVPLIRGILTGDTAYLDFGIHGIFGFYNAFANALGVLSFFAFLQTGRKKYLVVCLIICLAFVLFVTRQNVLSMLVQCTVVYCFVRGRISRVKLAAGAAFMLLLFSVAGTLRSGDIKQIAGIKDEYQGLPDGVIWIYAYSYFNVLNLDNVVTNPRLPVYDGSAILSLLPSFLRPETSHIDEEIELEEFNAYSYVAPIYADVGMWGAVLFTCGVMWWSVRSYQQALQDGSFYSISKYSVLFFCALFSFFVNFWFYLPIIFEIPIVAWMSKYILGPNTSRSAGDFSPAPART
jgi:oligosaccharide repeat unit polymerase